MVQLKDLQKPLVKWHLVNNMGVKMLSISWLLVHHLFSCSFWLFCSKSQYDWRVSVFNWWGKFKTQQETKFSL